MIAKSVVYLWGSKVEMLLVFLPRRNRDVFFFRCVESHHVQKDNNSVTALQFRPAARQSSTNSANTASDINRAVY